MREVLVLRNKGSIIYLGNIPKKNSKIDYEELGYKAGVCCESCDELVHTTSLYSSYMYVYNDVEVVRSTTIYCPCCNKDIVYPLIFNFEGKIFLL